MILINGFQNRVNIFYVFLLSTMKKLISLLAIVTLIIGCSTNKESTETKTKEVSNIGVDMPSELTVYMHTMEAKLQLIKKDISDQKVIDSTYFNDYKGIFSVTASDHVIRDSAFTHFGNNFLSQFSDLTKNNRPDSINDQYNAVVNSCVTCHKTYCPGPVERIQKLLLLN